MENFIMKKLGELLKPIDGYKTYIVGGLVIALGVMMNDYQLISIGVLALTGKHAITKVNVK